MAPARPIRPPRRVASRSVARYPFLELIEHDVLDDGVPDTRRVVTLAHQDWCVVVALDEDARWVFVEQHRHGVDALTLEPAGGIIDPGEQPSSAALRELVEETGYAAAGPELLLTVHPNPALSANRAFLYLVRGARRVAEPELRPDEQTRVHLLSRDEVAHAVRDGRVTHALSVIALLLALERA